MSKNPIDELNRAAFQSFGGDNFDPQGFGGDNFDPQGFEGFGGDNFDPNGNMYSGDSYRGHRSPRPVGAGTQIIRTSRTRPIYPDAQFDITLNATACTQNHNIELFNSQNSIEKFINNTSNSGLQPVGGGHVFNVRDNTNTGAVGLAMYGIGIYDYGTGTALNDVVYYDAQGNLVYNYNVTSSDDLVISCKQIPYRSLVTYSERGSFKVNKMRMKFSTSGQINNDITHQTKTFLGSVKTNIISVSSYFRPDQFQSLLVDVPVPFRIDAEKGLLYQLNATENTLINMFVSEYTKSAV